MAELADALDLGSSAARRGGSIPLVRTNRKIKAPGIREPFCIEKQNAIVESETLYVKLQALILARISVCFL